MAILECYRNLLAIILYKLTNVNYLLHHYHSKIKSHLKMVNQNLPFLQVNFSNFTGKNGKRVFGKMVNPSSHGASAQHLFSIIRPSTQETELY